jgi:hypothetical protein
MLSSLSSLLLSPGSPFLRDQGLRSGEQDGSQSFLCSVKVFRLRRPRTWGVLHSVTQGGHPRQERVATLSQTVMQLLMETVGSRSRAPVLCCGMMGGGERVGMQDQSTVSLS